MILQLYLYSLTLFLAEAGYDTKFGYGSDYPKTWPNKCNAGRHQSPIDICDVTEMKRHPRVDFVNYNIGGDVLVENNGHTIVVSGFKDWHDLRPYVSQNVDGKNHIYFLEQFHFHWGKNDSCGSEHTLNGQKFPLEIHFVHKRVSKNPTNAAKFDDHFVVGIFGTTDTCDGCLQTKLSGIPQALGGLTAIGETSNIDIEPLRDMFPTIMNSFYHYNGSLTTPGCDETVSWMILGNVLHVPHEYMKAFRKIRLSSPDPENNFRPIMARNEREVDHFYFPSAKINLIL